ncbi:MAG: integrase [Pseudomonas sp.]|uniref:integrase n=1 Tax=Pseudomonas sp. TaxID=306 RepID=UPI003D6E8E64
MSEVKESSQPFISAWYADRFINWIAHNWSPLNPHQQYNICIQGLEKMLNWSFANNRCLLDWTRADFENYSAFIINPTSVWVTSSKQTRFLGSPAMDFRDWPINPNWTVFRGVRGVNSDCDSSKEIDKNVWKREILCVKQFLGFYLKDVAAVRENVALVKPESLVFRPSQARGAIADEVLEWMLRTIPNLPINPHRGRLIAMYLTIARQSIRPMWQVLGNPSNPGRVDQFTRNGQGIWLEAHPKNGSSVPLPPAFGRAFDRYLTYLNIDPRQPLPASFLFPYEHSTSAHALRSFWRMTCSIRESLADLATTSDNLNIAQAADDIRRLTASMVSNPLLGKSEP